MRLCSGAGCGRKVLDDVRFCDECQADRSTKKLSIIRVHSTGYDDGLDRLRKGTRWQRIRDLAIKRCPMCARCNISISEIVDHIVPAREAIAQAQVSGRYPFDNYAGYFLMSNLQGLCRPCHHIKTQEDKLHVGSWPSVIEKEQTAPKKVWKF